jgi:hypothetical protein
MNQLDNEEQWNNPLRKVDYILFPRVYLVLLPQRDLDQSKLQPYQNESTSALQLRACLWSLFSVGLMLAVPPWPFRHRRPTAANVADAGSTYTCHATTASAAKLQDASSLPLKERPQIVQDAFQHNTSCILIDPTYPRKSRGRILDGQVT